MVISIGLQCISLLKKIVILIKVKKIKIYLLRYKLSNPVITSFGQMSSRPSLIIELIDEKNNSGFGEIWCNFPEYASEYRFKIFVNYFSKLILENDISDPENFYEKISHRLKILSIQSGDTGAFNNILSGIDCAIWDLFAKSKKIPLNKLFSQNSPNKIKVYASGINKNEYFDKINFARKFGINRFKIKIGFNYQEDIKIINLLENFIQKNENYMLDVNQGWPNEIAIKNLEKYKDYKSFWIEEPISADNDYETIKKLINMFSNLAFGENINSKEFFFKISNSTKIKFLQPDITKFGGISFIQQILKKIDGTRLWLHYLGGAIGLISSCHIMTHINPSGYMEMDINDNPLRTDILEPKINVKDGYIELNQSPGIGFSINYNNLSRYIIETYETD